MSAASPILGDRASPAARPGAPARPNTRVPTVIGRGAGAYGRSHEATALVFWVFALFLGLALASYQGEGGAAGAFGADWVGPVGAAVAHGLTSLVGVVAWGLPLELLLLGVPMVRGKESTATPGRIASDLLLAVVGSALAQVCSPNATFSATVSESNSAPD